MGSIDKALPHAGFYPDSQNRCSDGAKIRSIIESSKYFMTFFVARRFLTRFFLKDIKFIGVLQVLQHLPSYICTAIVVY